MKIEQILEILENYKLRIPPTVFYDLKADIVNFEEPITKNDLGVDCISRHALYDALYERFHEEDTNNITNVRLGSVRNFVKEFPPVTPQEREVLDKIRAEIQKLRNCSCSCSDGIIDDVEDILDKYKAESEGNNGD